MRFIHTSDWHIGKTLKGRDRLNEQAAVLTEIIAHATTHDVDAVLVAGDLYDTVAPTADAQRLVVSTLMQLRATGAEVIAIAGNHDHAPTFEAYRPLMDAAGITLVGQPRPSTHGGVVTFTARSTGENVRVAVLPFVSQRYAVSAAELVANSPAENSASYDEQVRGMVTALSEDFSAGSVNIVMAHLTVIGGAFGGGERTAQSIFEYSVPASIFGNTPHYVALGHLHRRQQLAAPCPVHYSGSPYAIDFGEQDNISAICLVEASPGVPAKVTDIEITSAAKLRTVRGTVAELGARSQELLDGFVRVWVQEPARAGLREEVAAILPNALEVRIDPDFLADKSHAHTPRTDGRRSAAELFDDFMTTQNVDDKRVTELFRRLHDETVSARSSGAST